MHQLHSMAPAAAISASARSCGSRASHRARDNSCRAWVNSTFRLGAMASMASGTWPKRRLAYQVMTLPMTPVGGSSRTRARAALVTGGTGAGGTAAGGTVGGRDGVGWVAVSVMPL